METVDEFESERDQQRDEQQKVGKIAGDPGAGGVDIGLNAVVDEKSAGRQNSKKQDHRQGVKALIEIWPGGRLDRPALVYRLIDCKIGHGTPLG